MALIGSGFDRDVGGVQGTGYLGGSLPYRSEYRAAGVTPEIWLSWSETKQSLWLQDFNRSNTQANFFKDSNQRKAFDYVSFIDNSRDDIVEYGANIADLGQTYTRNVAIAAVALLILLRGS